MSGSVPEVAYDVAFLEAVYHNAGSLARDLEEDFGYCEEDAGRSMWYFHLWYAAFLDAYAPADHPVTRRLWQELCQRAQISERCYLPSDDDQEGWQALRDTVGDLHIVRFVYWFGDVAKHPFVRELAQQFGISRWLDLAIRDTGLPSESTFTCNDPMGANWRRACLAEYRYPVELPITADEVRSAVQWIDTVTEHMYRAAGEIDAIRVEVEMALADAGFPVSHLIGTFSRKARFLETLTMEPEEARQVLYELLKESLAARDARVQGLEQSSTSEPHDILEAFRLFWMLWMAWYPAVLAQRGRIPLSASFPPPAEDQPAWEVIAAELGELPLARFCYWFSRVAECTWEQIQARELGIAERLAAILRAPGHPDLAAENDSALLALRWRYSPTELPPVTADEARSIFTWLERVSGRIMAVLAIVRDI